MAPPKTKRQEKKKLKTKSRKTWCEDDINDALDQISVGAIKIRAAARKHGMSEGNLRRRMKMIKEGKSLVGSGRRPCLSEEEEKQLARCITVLCNTGFSPSTVEIKDIVHDYVTIRGIKSPFKDQRPGKEWLYGFMRRQNLSLKKANMISAARKSATANPFIINDFYDVIEKVITDKKLKPEQVWNCDESGFPTDPNKSKVIAPHGTVGYKTTWGAGRENISILAACNAAGRVLDPLIIFSGKNFQSTWKGEKALPNTAYGISANGWMTTDVFLDWFKQFSIQVKERPILLIYDGHLSHVSIDLIERAQAEEITLIKLPPHVTDKLQPLDVCCFGPLKREWERLLSDRVNVLGPRETISRTIFVDLLSSIWHKGLSPSNAISGFRATGVYPVDRDKYPAERYDKRLLKRYDQWVASGRPEAEMDEFAASLNTPKKAKPVEKQKSRFNILVGDEITPPETSSTPTVKDDDSNTCNCEVCKMIGPKPQPIPGNVWVPAWALQPKPALNISKDNTSFEELVLDKMKGPQERKVVKRKKIYRKAKVLTQEEYLEELKAMEEESKLKKVKKAPPKERKIKAAKKKIEFEEEEDVTFDVNDEDEITHLSAEEETEEEVIESEEDEDSEVDSEGNEENEEYRLVRLWNLLNPPTKEEEIVQKWYAAIFEDGKKKFLFVGKALKRFLANVDGPTEGIELDCLVPPVGNVTILKSVPAHRPRDIGVFSLHNIIDGPLTVEPLKRDQWNVPEYTNLKNKFEKALNIDRESLVKTM